MNPKTIKTILAPTDFSDNSWNSIKTTASIYVRQDASLILFHVIDFFKAAMIYDNVYIENHLAEFKKNAEDRLKEIQNQIRKKYKITSQTIVETGNVPELICEKAAMKTADLIVMGSHGNSGFREFFLGSNSYRVLKQSYRPVLIVPHDKEYVSFRKILFPVRYIPEALEKYEFARLIIQKNDSTLFVLGLSNDKNYTIYDVSSIVNKLNDALTEDKVQSETIYRICSNFAEEVLRVADEKDADMIIITSSLDALSRKFLIGPYAQKIINHSKVPVLSIKPDPYSDWNKNLQTEDVDYFDLLMDC